MSIYLDFEDKLSEIDKKIKSLKEIAGSDDHGVIENINKLEEEYKNKLEKIYSNLTAWQRVKVARHPERPHFKDYINGMIDDFMPLAGDRKFGEDNALIGGIGRFRGRTVVVMGQEKGWDTKSRMLHNFGSARPEGYRKAVRLMELAEQYSVPILSLVDTAGAYPGVGAEERGQAEAIASSIEKGIGVRTPYISTIIGEGGSGGAIAIATADKILMLENAIYSVISPEGCASILWRSADFAKNATEALKITSNDLKNFKVIDDIIKEPIGGAHRNHAETIKSAGDAIEKNLKNICGINIDTLVTIRNKKFLSMSR